MKQFLQKITDRVATKKGMWITLISWFTFTILLTLFSPNVKDYEQTRIDSLPDHAQSVIAEQKVDEYFKESDGIPAIIVFESEGEIEFSELIEIFDQIESENIDGIQQMIPLSTMPQQAVASFLSEDQKTAAIPITLESSLDNVEMKEVNQRIMEIVHNSSNLELYITGPAGIAVDSLDLFSRADLVLILSTVALIFVLLIIIYRSPLLALIPLMAAGVVYEIVMGIIGYMGKMGLDISKQTLSIMSILLFAAVIDYSLFVFSRYREELKSDENKFEAMKVAMRETGMPVFFSGGTVLAAMLVLFFAQFGDYNNFAPIFATTMAIIMLASISLVPALFTLFGRRSFWPRIPRVGDEKVKQNATWSKVGRFVVKKPRITSTVIGVFLLLAATNIFHMEYEFDTMKSFPEDMPSRQGYEILEEHFEKGDLAPTTVLYEGNTAVTSEQQENLVNELLTNPLVSQVRFSGTTEDGKVLMFTLSFKESPYAVETIDAMEDIINEKEQMVANSGLDGELYFSGETATRVDERVVNNRDIIVIVLLETALIFAMLIVLTKSVKMPIYMMGTILVSFLSALGLGTFLTNLIFDIGAISDRVPLYSFVFLVALGIDYNIILISRFQEERRKHPVKKAVELAVANTGGVISSAGIILAATFAVLMTQPVQLLFVFGFIVAVGILLDTFIIRGFLLPSLIVMFEKDQHGQELRQ
ncbi:MMPL family transporter [Fervidibacillus albus]|uniref:MMPL family transporter n=1 Tax=Fervidibacillus albus TaxID=2980026 RepID=A0A9E8LSU9_9BACI|nr:MMPL family transporter [Fervidibacillus albus]WAA08963.1 MMPL family transporter [Fervidibacillus albus]